MKKIIIFLAIFISIGKNAVAQQEPLTAFQKYAAALYLIRHQPVEMNDTASFLLNKKWIKMTGTYIHDLEKESDSSHYYAQKLNLPTIEKLGITIEFYSKQHAKDWLETPSFKKLIQMTGIELSYELTAYYFYHHQDSSILTLISDKYINWYAVINWLQSNYELNIRQYGYFTARIMENSIWEKYEPHDCADECSDYVWYMDYENKNRIIWGHNYHAMSIGWATIGWIWNYNIKTRKFEKIVKDDPHKEMMKMKGY